MKKFILFSSFFLFSFITGLIGVINHGHKSVIACVYGPSGECVDTWYSAYDDCTEYHDNCTVVVAKCDWDENGPEGCDPGMQYPCAMACD